MIFDIRPLKRAKTATPGFAGPGAHRHFSVLLLCLRGNVSILKIERLDQVHLLEVTIWQLIWIIMFIFS